MVPDSKRKLALFTSFLLGSLPVGSFQTTGPKRDGTVFLRCKSTEEHSAFHVSFQLVRALNEACVEFTQTDDCKFRVSLEHFGPR